MIRTVALGGLLAIGFVVAIDPWPRYLGRVSAEVVDVQGRGRFSGPTMGIEVRLEEGAIIPVTIADTTVRVGDRVVLLAYESRLFKRRSYDVSMEGPSRSTNRAAAGNN